MIFNVHNDRRYILELLENNDFNKKKIILTIRI